MLGWTRRDYDSSVRNSWQEYPQKSIFPFGGNSSLIITGRNVHLSLEPTVVDLHVNDPDGFSDGGKWHLELLERFGRFPKSTDPQTPETNFHFNLFGRHAGQFGADSKAGGTLKNVDRGAPLHTGIAKVREMNFRNLVGNLSNLAFEKPQTKRTGFSAH